ncbi:MAG: hypothetical protein ACTSU5_00275 [Promethearchaeota archaeon]
MSEQKIQQIGELSRDEAQVLKVVLLKSVATISTISAYLKKKPDLVASVVSSLEQKKLLRPVGDKLAKRYVAVAPYGGFLRYLDKFTSELSAQREEVKSASSPQNIDFSEVAASTGSEVETSLKADFEKILAEGQSNNEVTVQDVQKAIDKQAKDFESQKAALKRDITSMLDKYKKNQDTLASKFASQVEKSEAALDNKLGQLVPPLEQAVSGLKASTESTFSGYKSTLESSLSDQAAKIAGAISGLVDSSESSVAALKSKVKADVQASLEQLEGSVKALKEATSSDVNAALATFSTQVDEFEKSTSGVLTGLDGDIKSKLEGYKGATTSTLDEFKSGVGEAYDTIKADIDVKVQELKGVLAQETEVLVDTHLATTREKTMAMRDKLSSTIEEYIDTFMKGADDVKEAVTANVDAELERVKTEIREALAKIQDQYLARIEQQGAEFQTEIKNSINEKVVDMRHELKLMGEEFTESLDEASANFEAAMRSTREGFLTQVDTFRETLAEELAKQVAGGNEKVAGIVTEKSATVEELTSSSIGEVNSLIRKSVDGVSRIVEATKSELGKKVAANLEQLDSTTETKLEEVKTSLPGKVDEDVGNWEQGLSEFTTSAKAVNETLGMSLDAFKTQASEIIQSNLDSLSKALDDAVAKVNPAVEEFKQAARQGTTGIAEEIKTHFANQKAEYMKIIDEFTPKVAKTLDGTVESLKGVLSSFEQKTKTLLGKMSGILGSSAATVKGKLTAKVNEVQKALGTKIAALLSKVIAAINAGIDAGAEPKKVLAGAWGEIVETELLDADLTWHLIGEDSIFPYVKDMIARAKSSVFIVTRSYKDLDWNQIYEAQARGKKFVVACDLAAASQKKLAEGLEKGIDLWNYDGKDIIGVIRDQEEILLAAINPKQDETVGVISEMEPFVIHLGGMMNDYWRRHARKYQVS